MELRKARGSHSVDAERTLVREAAEHLEAAIQRLLEILGEAARELTERIDQLDERIGTSPKR